MVSRDEPTIRHQTYIINTSLVPAKRHTPVDELQKQSESARNDQLQSLLKRIMSLIEHLKNEHQEIFRVLEKCLAQVVPEERRKSLKQARSLVVAHLAREDSKLYPHMQAHAETKQLATTFASEMKDISSEVLSFFDALERGESGMDFARKMGGTIAHLRQRMTREELRLYSAYEQYCA